MGQKEKLINLTEGSVAKGLWEFTLPLMLGQLLQQLYNVADAWVIGNYADNASFAAVSAGGSLTFLVVGFFNGISIGGGVVISRYFGAQDHSNVSKAIHTNVLFGLIASILATVLTVWLTPQMLKKQFAICNRWIIGFSLAEVCFYTVAFESSITEALCYFIYFI